MYHRPTETWTFWATMLIVGLAMIALADACCGAQRDVVRIRVSEPNGRSSLGTGTYIGTTAEGYGAILTAWHLFSESRGPICVEFPSGQQWMATLHATDRLDDLALITIADPPEGGTPVSERNYREGEQLTIAGYGGQGQYLAQPCRVLHRTSFDGGHTWTSLAVSMRARQGDSGGPIFDSEGYVCGVISGARPGETVGTCGTEIFRHVQQWCPNGDCARPRMIPVPQMRPRPTAPIPRLIAPQRPKPPGGNSAEAAPRPDIEPTRPVGPIARSDDIQTLKAAIVAIEAKIDAAACKCDKTADTPPSRPDDCADVRAELAQLRADISTHNAAVASAIAKISVNVKSAVPRKPTEKKPNGEPAYFEIVPRKKTSGGS